MVLQKLSNFYSTWKKQNVWSNINACHGQEGLETQFLSFTSGEYGKGQNCKFSKTKETKEDSVVVKLTFV